MKLTIELAIDNAAFKDNPKELGRILDQVRIWAEDRCEPSSRRLRDINGSDVGYAQINTGSDPTVLALLAIIKDILPEGSDYSDGEHCDECGTAKKRPDQEQCDVPGCFYVRVRTAIAINQLI